MSLNPLNYETFIFGDRSYRSEAMFHLFGCCNKWYFKMVHFKVDDYAREKFKNVEVGIPYTLEDVELLKAKLNILNNTSGSDEAFDALCYLTTEAILVQD